MKLFSLLSILLVAALTPMPKASASSTPSAAARPISNASLKFFTLPGCDYCTKAKAFMAKKQIPYQEIDLSSVEGAKAAETLDVPLMAPMFAFKNRILRGFTPEKLENFLRD